MTNFWDKLNNTTTDSTDIQRKINIINNLMPIKLTSYMHRQIP